MPETLNSGSDGYQSLTPADITAKRTTRRAFRIDLLLVLGTNGKMNRIPHLRDKARGMFTGRSRALHLYVAALALAAVATAAALILTGETIGNPWIVLMLAVAAMRDNKPNEAKVLLSDLVRDYPRNPLYAQELSRLQTGTARP